MCVVGFFVVFHLCVMAGLNDIVLFLLPLKVSETQEHSLERDSPTGLECYGFIV